MSQTSLSKLKLENHRSSETTDATDSTFSPETARSNTPKKDQSKKLTKINEKKRFEPCDETTTSSSPRRSGKNGFKTSVKLALRKLKRFRRKIFFL